MSYGSPLRPGSPVDQARQAEAEEERTSSYSGGGDFFDGIFGGIIELLVYPITIFIYDLSGGLYHSRICPINNRHAHG